MAVFSLLARVAFMAAQNSGGQKRLDHLRVMVDSLEAASMFGEGEIGCVEVGIDLEEVCALRHRAERETFRQDPSRWDPRVPKKETPAEGSYKGLLTDSEIRMQELLRDLKATGGVVFSDEGGNKGRSN